MTPSAKRQAIALLVSEHRLSVVRACQVARLARAAWYRPPQDRLARDAPVIEALTAQVEQNPRWGFWKLFDRLHNLGQPWNPKRVVALHGAPATLRLDNEPEFLAVRLSDWAEHRGIILDFIQPGKPAQNAFIERFNQTYRTEILDASVFRSLPEVRAITRDWLRRYNTERPHDSLGRVPPLTFLPRASTAPEYHFQLSTR